MQHPLCSFQQSCPCRFFTSHSSPHCRTSPTSMASFRVKPLQIPVANHADRLLKCSRIARSHKFFAVAINGSPLHLRVRHASSTPTSILRSRRTQALCLSFFGRGVNVKQSAGLLRRLSRGPRLLAMQQISFVGQRFWLTMAPGAFVA